LIFKKVLEPIRQLVQETENPRQFLRFEDEIKTLSTHIHTLIRNVDQTKNKLEVSREHLQQTEKLAMVGKLAAGVAHSIRTPLTSVKMRLFSLERSLKLNEVQKKDFEVISEEIRHIDTIMTNFLEFSRRPKLKTQPFDPSEPVQLALQLMRHRLESYGVKVKIEKDTALPRAMLDMDQLKEVIVNILENACDAMEQGGKIHIQIQKGVVEPLGHVVRIKISDNGPGIPAHLQEKIFQPFFSTKEEGTGLGLSIAKRIIEDHNGWINVQSKTGEGTVFTITLPSLGEQRWLKSS
jgi:signal transduction histidine kinase